MVPMELKNYTQYNNLKRINIGLIVCGTEENYGFCSCIRLLSPLSELLNEYSISIIGNDNATDFYKDILENKNCFDLIIIQREIIANNKLNNLECVKQIFLQCKRDNVPIIFDIDDDLLNIDKTHPGHEELQRVMPLLKYIISNSDIITVPNNILKTQLLNFDKNIHVEIIPNILVQSWDFNPNQKKERDLKLKNTIKIGYFGGNTHHDDLKIIKKSINNVQEYFHDKKIIFEVIGITDKKLDWANKVIIPNNYNSNPTLKQKLKNIASMILQKFNIYNPKLPFYTFVNWMKNEIDLDIGVAPLEDTYINRSKSNLKYLEYTAMGIPGVYSNIGPYKEINEKNTGLVVNNNTEEWEYALIRLIEDSKLYERILDNANNDVSKNYLVGNVILIWKNIIGNLIKK